MATQTHKQKQTHKEFEQWPMDCNFPSACCWQARTVRNTRKAAEACGTRISAPILSRCLFCLCVGCGLIRGDQVFGLLLVITSKCGQIMT